MACLYRRVVTVAGRRGWLRCAAALAALAAAGMLALELGEPVPVPAAGALGAMLGLARAALTLAWMEAFCRFGMREACVGFACSTLVGMAAVMAFSLLPSWAVAVASGAAGVAAALLVPRLAPGEAGSGDARAAVVGRPGQGGRTAASDQPSWASWSAAAAGPDAEGSPGRWSFPLQPTLLMGVFAASALLVAELAPAACADPTPSGFASAVAAACLLAMALLWFERLDIRVLSSVAVPLECLGLLGALSGFAYLGLPAVLSARLGYQLFSTFMFVLLFNISYRYGVSPLWLFGFSRVARIAAAIAVPMLTGTGVLTAPSHAADVVLAGALVVLVASSSLLAVGESFSTTWGIRPLADGRGRRAEDGGESAGLSGWLRGEDGLGRGGGLGLAGGDGLPAASVEALCRRAAFLHSLTRREEEVLVLLVRGMSTPEIERELTISNGTARNHVQHVYKKLGVHSREELRVLVGSGQRRPGADRR